MSHSQTSLSRRPEQNKVSEAIGLSPFCLCFDPLLASLLSLTFFKEEKRNVEIGRLPAGLKCHFQADFVATPSSAGP